MTLLNRARMTTATTGTGTVTLGSAVSGYATFAEAGAVNAATYDYTIVDGTDFEMGVGTYTSSGTTFSRDTVTISKISGTAGTSKIDLSGSAQIFISPRALSILQPNSTRTVTVGYTLTPNNIGTVSSGTTTPNPALGNYQYYTNNGAHTLAAPEAGDCAIDILVTNGASAGSITFSGFTVGASTGSSLTTTNTHRFLISIRRINSVSTYSVYALQ